MILWEVLVPTSSSKKNFTLVHHQAWDEKVQEIVGGLSIMKTLKVQWQGPEGAIYKDRMLPVRIACSYEQIEKIMQITRKHYDEIEIMAYKISDTVLFANEEGVGMETVGFMPVAVATG